MTGTSTLVRWLVPSLVSDPVYDALASGLRGFILDGRLVSGTRIPAERQLASALGLSRSTVTAAYDRLRDEGYLQSRRGSGTVVTVPDPTITRPDDRIGQRPVTYDLTVAALAVPAPFLDLVHAAVDRLPGLLAGPGLQPMGLRELRQAIADRYRERGLPTAADDVFVTQGALHGWDLMLRALTRPGAAVVVEQPSYPGVLDAAVAHHTRVVPLPVDSTGWDLSQLDHRAGSSLWHVTPDSQNPTGWWADNPARRALLAAAPASTLIVADESFAELRLDGAVTRPLAALGRRGQVVTLGSMSKSFWPGLRIGWIRGPRDLLRRLAYMRAGQDLASPVFEQLVACELLGCADAILAERRKVLTGQRQALLQALAVHAPTWHAAVPVGGLVLWVDLGDLSSTWLAEEAAGRGIRLTPGPRFSAHATHDRWLRLPFTLAPSQLDEVVRILSDIAGRAVGAPSPRRTAAGRTWTA